MLTKLVEASGHALSIDLVRVADHGLPYADEERSRRLGRRSSLPLASMG